MYRSLKRIALPAALALAFAAGCESMPWNQDDERDAQKMDASGAEKKVAVAKIRHSPAATTRPAWGKPSGTVTFTDMGDKVRIVADLSGLTPGKHGFHIHEKGDLSADDFSSAGDHFNPEGHPHAGPDKKPRHAGDLGNIEADASGNAKKTLTVDNITVGGGGENDILGKAVILHAQADDLKSQPSGDAGGRIGGGIIEMKK